MSVDIAALERVFNPRTVVVFGDKKASGYMWLNGMRRFKGNLYSVQVDPSEIANIEAMGVTNFTSLAQVPEPVDYAVCAVPRSVAPRVVADCIAHNVGGVTLFTAGYAETGTEDGKAAQDQLFALAREAGMVLIGPNCMGLHNPSLGVCFFPEQPVYEGGNVGFASQSGSHANSFSIAAPESGLFISKMISFGNGIVLENADYLEYLAQDPQTEAIAMYVESVQDGRRLFRLLRETTPRKPVLIWKGGQTDAGKRATASHTAALAESMAIWEAVARQTGALLVHSLDEALDTLKALLRLPPFSGPGCGLTGGTGGQSVSITDAFAKGGMTVPTLSPDSYRRLQEFFSLVGASYRNPIDMGSNRTEMDTILDILAEDPAIDVIVMQMGYLGGQRQQSQLETQFDALVRLRQRTAKPVVAIPTSPTPYRNADVLREIDEKLRAGGVPSYPSYERAAHALK
ncbi:MAG: CoA-binding protein, partial [Dehalococcoidia bacterium]